MIGTAGVDPQPDLAVIDQQARAGFQCREDLGMGKLHPRGIAGLVLQIEAEAVALFQVMRAGGELAHAQLRPLQIAENRDRAAGIGLDLADDVIARLVILMAAMAHVQAEHVGTGIEQGADGIIVGGRWPQRRHDLHITVASHSVPSDWVVHVSAIMAERHSRDNWQSVKN